MHSTLFLLLRQALRDNDAQLLNIAADELAGMCDCIGIDKSTEAVRYEAKLRKIPFKGCTNVILYYEINGLSFLCDLVMKFGNKIDKKLLGKTYRGLKYALKHTGLQFKRNNKNYVDWREELLLKFIGE